MGGSHAARAGDRLGTRPIPRAAIAAGLIEEARAGNALGSLTAGHKKDVVITTALLAHPGRVAIYGWQWLNEPGHEDGSPIQPLDATSHAGNYADYGHGIRLVANVMAVDGADRALVDVLADPDLCGLVSGEGVLTVPRYATDGWCAVTKASKEPCKRGRACFLAAFLQRVRVPPR